MQDRDKPNNLDAWWHFIHDCQTSRLHVKCNSKFRIFYLFWFCSAKHLLRAKLGPNMKMNFFHKIGCHIFIYYKEVDALNMIKGTYLAIMSLCFILFLFGWVSLAPMRGEWKDLNQWSLFREKWLLTNNATSWGFLKGCHFSLFLI